MKEILKNFNIRISSTMLKTYLPDRNANKFLAAHLIIFLPLPPSFILSFWRYLFAPSYYNNPICHTFAKTKRPNVTDTIPKDSWCAPGSLGVIQFPLQDMGRAPIPKILRTRVEALRCIWWRHIITRAKVLLPPCLIISDNLARALAVSAH